MDMKPPEPNKKDKAVLESSRKQSEKSCGSTEIKIKRKSIMDIREYLRAHRLVTDGAMGTYYAALKKQESLVSEWANINEPGVVAGIHRAYLAAGAVLIRTNTFAAGRQVLGTGIKEQEKIVRAACRIARKEIAAHTARTGKPCFLAGDIGPLRELSEHGEPADTGVEYRFLVDLFLEEGVDALWFETFPDLGGMGQAAAYAKEKCPGIFCAGLFSVNQNGYSAAGIRASRLIAQAERVEALDAVGLNCGVGSAHMLHIVENLHLPEYKYFCALPNAGYPEQLQSRMVFVRNENYFCRNMERIAAHGVSIVGACCGSSPEYIREITENVPLSRPEADRGGRLPQDKEEKSSAVCAGEKAAPQIIVGADISGDENADGKAGVDARIRTENNFLMRLFSRKKVIAVELDPPYDADDAKIIAAAKRLKELGVDIITIADSPQGRSRMDSVLTAVKLTGITGMPVMPHVCCRDKNMIAMRSMLLGAYANEIRNFLFVTGDPVPGELRSSATGVFDYNSMKLMGFVREMNREHFADEPIVYGGALNQGRVNFDKEMERTRKKIEAGASYFLTQPVYGAEDIRRLGQLKQTLKTRLLAGIMPLVSYRNANFVKNELVGINVPDEVLAAYRPDMGREEGEEAGVRIAFGVMEKLDCFVDGYYFMLPFNRVGLMKKIISGMSTAEGEKS